ncbi:hypothetical protein FRB94_003710 [Tulasnella sp. JGI-2019a]|nr:hypothetical protein FRB94_003710 [Tulasnella sp. JGI-2019a]
MGAAKNRTFEFRELCSNQPEAKPKRRPKRADDAMQIQAAQAYLAEGYTILKHITTLTSLLASSRRAYLNVDANQSSARQARSFDLSNASSDGNVDAFSSLKSLTNEERDQIDLQARILLSKCADRVKEMEIVEKRRRDAAVAQTNPLARLLPSRLTGSSSNAAADLIAAHRTNITWYLTRRLADASQTQKEMQEERIRRQTERTKTLGSSAAAYDAAMLSQPEVQEKSKFGSFGSFIRGGPSKPESGFQTQQPPPEDGYASEEEDELELTPGQMQQFEEENAALLRSVEDTLATIQLAESRLMDISSLQTELIVQLTRQAEVVDQLYDEAITSQGEVEKGHVQLKKARDRARESRKWILFFILGATGAMLFLHWYD